MQPHPSGRLHQSEHKRRVDNVQRLQRQHNQPSTFRQRDPEQRKVMSSTVPSAPKDPTASQPTPRPKDACNNIFKSNRIQSITKSRVSVPTAPRTQQGQVAIHSTFKTKGSTKELPPKTMEAIRGTDYPRVGPQLDAKEGNLHSSGRLHQSEQH